MLDISRLDTGAMKPEITLFRIDEILKPLAIEFEPLAKEKGLDLPLCPAPRPCAPTAGCCVACFRT